MTSAGTDMARTADLSIRSLDRADGDAFATLTAPALRWLLAAETLPHHVHRLGAFLGSQPAGLLLACPGTDGLVELSSIMVAPACRRRGIGHALMTAFAAAVAATGPSGLVARWSDRLPRAPEFSRLLAATGWSAPVQTRHRMTWRVGDWRTGFPARDRILARLRDQGLVDRSLAELGPEGTSELTRQNASLVSAGRAPEWAHARGWIQASDPETTVALLDRGGTLHGWIVCFHQTHLNRWYVPQGWVVEEKVPSGWLVGGIASLATRLEAKGGPDALVIAQPPSGIERGMERMLHRHFGAHAVATDFLNESTLLFRNGSG